MRLPLESVRRRFSSIEPKSPASPLPSPGGLDNHIYTVPDHDDTVFTDSNDPVKDADLDNNFVPPPPTPGTAPYANQNTSSNNGWSQRKLRFRDIALIVIGVVLLVGLAVGTALAIILVNNDTPSSSSSSSAQEQEGKTTSSEEVQYNGHFHLTTPWQGSKDELQNVFLKDLNNILEEDPLREAFITSSIQEISANNSFVTFALRFKKDELEESVASNGLDNTGEQGSSESEGQASSSSSVASYLQTSLNNQVVRHLDDIQLPIMENSLVIYENIPISSTSSTTMASTSESQVSTTESVTTDKPTEISTVTTSGTKQTVASTTTIDATTTKDQEVTTTTAATTTEIPPNQCVDLNFSTCQDILGSMTFNLPNWYGHTTAEEAERVYDFLLSKKVSGAEASLCEDTSKLYLCSLLFPPCDKSGAEVDGTSSPIYPCDTLCKAVLNECGEIEDWPKDCDVFPATACTLPPTLPVTSTTSTPSSTSTTAVNNFTSTSASGSTYQCSHLDFQTCNNLEIHRSLLPNDAWNCEDNNCLIQIFDAYARQSVAANCIEAVDFFCVNIFHGCSEEALVPVKPCRELCQAAVTECSEYIPDELKPNCEEFVPAEGDSDCIQPYEENYQCIDQTYELCRQIGFTTNSDSSDWFSSSDNIVEDFETYAIPNITSGCYELAAFFWCGVSFPACGVDNYPVYPCLEYCKEISAKCEGFRFSCDFLEEQTTCLRPSDITMATTTTLSTTTTMTTTTTRDPSCEKLQSPLCETFGYADVILPNAYGSMTQTSANETYYKYAELSVSVGCSEDIAFFMCTTLFPPCENGQMVKPCNDICETINSECQSLFQQECAVVAEADPNKCLRRPEKPDCADNQFTCVNSNKCVPQEAVCDKKNDCEDWSDERNCDCNPTLEIQCQMGLCIPNFQQCDDIVQCPDQSDESGCELHSCKMGQYSCMNSTKCIQPEWVCDTFNDCPLSDDELYCNTIKCDDEWACWNNKLCVPYTKLCDGSKDCSDNSDEYRCVATGTEEGISLHVVYDNGPNLARVCAESFTQEHAITACLKEGYPSVESWEGKEDVENYHTFVQLDVNGQTISPIGNVINLGGSKCPDNKIVFLKCSPRECGWPSNNAANLVIGGQDALPGTWPWVASLQHANVHICGGAIIHPYFVVTAAHCTRDIIGGTSLLMVVAGTVDLNEASVYDTDHPDYVQMKQVRRFIQYPGYMQFDGKDIALIELTSPLTYSASVQPVCIPDDDEVFGKTSECYLTGWGQTEADGAKSSTLQETKMTLVDTQTCNSSDMWDGAMAQGEKCAGYYNALITACSGDSGSPVACRNDDFSWKVVGVTSYVRQGCSVPRYPTVYTDVLKYKEWINETTEMVFVCTNGISLFDKEMLCNAVDDCGDKTDEIQNCDITANCTFDDKFICGYNSDWTMAYGAHNQIKNRFPLYDHTIGKYPGSYQLGFAIGDDLMSPRIDLITNHCLRFHYHMRGYVTLGLSVYGHEISMKNWTTYIDEGNNEFFPDKWLMITIDLSPGNYDIDIRAHDDAACSVDDIFIMEGTCGDIKCFADEFMCLTFGRRNCLPLAVRCNTVIDCDNSEDEIDCDDPSDYFCNFENGNLCGIQQDSQDSFASEWTLVNSTATPANMKDHTSGTDSGVMMMIPTSPLVTGLSVNAFMEVLLRTYEHCFSLYYFSNSEFTFQISLAYDGREDILLTFINRHTTGWAHTQVTLPAVASKVAANLTLNVIGGEITSISNDDTVIIVDDLAITHGQCPEFSCPDGVMMCENEAHCVTSDRVCDNILDCAEATDEAACVCSAAEFKCPNGPCITLERTCDRVKDCSDGSDEGVVCDDKRTISCNFEDAFWCGYTGNTSISNLHWDRYQGFVVSGGPHTDHTYANDANSKGHYMMGQVQLDGNFAALTSPPFTSMGNGLIFQYYAFNPFSQLEETGRLVLIATDVNTGVQYELWKEISDSQESWKEACVDLPKDDLTISFVVWKGENYSTYIALDDIQFLDVSCDTHSVGGRMAYTERTEMITTTSPACPEDHTKCPSGLCIMTSSLCDGIDDCPDNYDESDCD